MSFNQRQRIFYPNRRGHTDKRASVDQLRATSKDTNMRHQKLLILSLISQILRNSSGSFFKIEWNSKKKDYADRTIYIFLILRDWWQLLWSVYVRPQNLDALLEQWCEFFQMYEHLSACFHFSEFFLLTWWVCRTMTQPF